MLGFLRKHQRIFFYVITVVIVVSFSFFGTYSSLTNDTISSPVAFTTVTGDEISRAELNTLTTFLSTDATDQLFSQRIWGVNVFNNGVIRNDFMETGLARMLIKQYVDVFSDELSSHLVHEKRFSPYTNQEAPFISAENIWTTFAPEIKKNLDALQAADSATDRSSIDSRIQLFLAERNFSPLQLMQMIRYQEQQYAGIAADPSLQQRDLSLFGYHTVKDWFGSKFLDLVGQVIINTSLLAEERGYTVSDAEVLADLIKNGDTNLSTLKKHQWISSDVTSDSYFKDQLNSLGIDISSAKKSWRHVMLFRKLMANSGDTILLDILPYKLFHDYAGETAAVDVYSLPKTLQLRDFTDLQKFETYLRAVTKKYPSLDLPTAFLTPDEVEKKYPELVQRRYRVSIARADTRDLQVRVGLKEALDWQLSEKNWKILAEKFPVLGAQIADSQSARLKILNELDPTTRDRVDFFTRTTIVAAHPEWLDEALAKAKVETKIMTVRSRDSTLSDEGREHFVSLLNSAPINGETVTPEKQHAADALKKFSSDGIVFSNITVLDRLPEKEVVYFAEASKDGTLDGLVTKELDNYYHEIRGNDTAHYLDTSGNWKPLDAVRNEIAERYYRKIIAMVCADAPIKEKNGALAAQYRFYRHVSAVRNMFIAGAADVNEYIVTTPVRDSIAGKLVVSAPLRQQWCLEKNNIGIARNNRRSSTLSDEDIFSMDIGTWSAVTAQRNGVTSFLTVVDKGIAERTLSYTMQESRKALDYDAQRREMKNLLAEMTARGALSFEDLTEGSEG